MRFYRWLDELIGTGYGDEELPRKEVIAIFVNKGLYPWVKKNGWAWAITEKALRNQIASGLFINERKHTFSSNWSFKTSNMEYHDEYKHRFNHTFGPELWDDFWDTWGQWEDVDSSNDYGAHRRIDIQNYIWYQIDLESSAEAHIVDDLLFDEEDTNYLVSSSTTKRESDDIYLYESAESGQYGGYRR